jgi:hypothetical protein
LSTLSVNTVWTKVEVRKAVKIVKRTGDIQIIKRAERQSAPMLRYPCASPCGSAFPVVEDHAVHAQRHHNARTCRLAVPLVKLLADLGREYGVEPSVVESFISAVRARGGKLTL